MAAVLLLQVAWRRDCGQVGLRRILALAAALVTDRRGWNFTPAVESGEYQSNGGGAKNGARLTIGRPCRYWRRPATWLWLAMGASLAVVAPAHAEVFCVASPGSLMAALASAQGNHQADEIRIRSGTYPAPAGGWSFQDSQPFALEISGRWNAGCTNTRGMAASILDGGGIHPVMRVYNQAGFLTIRRLVFRNGLDDGSVPGRAGGLAVNSGLGSGVGVTIELNEFWYNTGQPASGNLLLTGGLRAATAQGELRVRNNLFVGNVGRLGAAAHLRLESGAVGLVTSNTAVGNLASGSVALWLGLFSDGGLFTVTNNVFWGNDHADLSFQDLKATLYFNDIGHFYGMPLPGSAGNVAIDPIFASPAELNFRLAPDSPLIDAGFNLAPGGLSQTDLDGAVRVVNGVVDLGAFELSDRIFAAGFQ